MLLEADVGIVLRRVNNFQKLLATVTTVLCQLFLFTLLYADSSNTRETDILAAFEIWLKEETGKHITLQREVYDVDLRKLVCEQPIEFSIPKLSRTMVKAECPNYWRRFIKAPENSLSSPVSSGDSEKGLAATADIRKGDQVSESSFTSVKIGRGTPRNVVTRLPQETVLYAQRTIPKGGLILQTDISAPAQVYRAKSTLMPMQAIQSELFEAFYLKTDIPEDALLTIANLENFSLAVKLTEGDILRQRHLRKRKLISRGDVVNVEYATEHFSITTRVVALEDGYIGDTVRVRNEESGRRLTARVAGPNRLRFEN